MIWKSGSSWKSCPSWAPARALQLEAERKSERRQKRAGPSRRALSPWAGTRARGRRSRRPTQSRRLWRQRRRQLSGRWPPAVGVITFFVCGAFGVGEAVQAAGRGRRAAQLWSCTTGAVGMVAQFLGGGLLNQRVEILIISAPKASWEF